MVINSIEATRLKVCLAKSLGLNPCSGESGHSNLNQHGAFFFPLATDNTDNSFRRLICLFPLFKWVIDSERGC